MTFVDVVINGRSVLLKTFWLTLESILGLLETLDC